MGTTEAVQSDSDTKKIEDFLDAFFNVVAAENNEVKKENTPELEKTMNEQDMSKILQDMEKQLYLRQTLSRKPNLLGLIVLILIIGVLLVIAIPRLATATTRSTAPEPPRILASFESDHLSAIAETHPGLAVKNEEPYSSAFLQSCAACSEGE